MNIRDYWLKFSPAIRTAKNNKSLVVPAFSNVGCGPVKQAVYCIETVSYKDTGVSTIDSLDLSTTFTIECLVNPFGNFDSAIQCLYSMSSIHNDINLYITNGVANIQVYKGGVAQTVLSGVTRITPHAWQHIAATYDGTNLRLYINGKLDATSGAINSPIDAATSLHNYITTQPVTGVPGNFLYGWFAEFRLWNVCRTPDQIGAAMTAHRNITGTVDVGLIRYYKFGGTPGVGVATINSIDGHSMSLSSDSSIVAVDDLPLGYGASFIANRFTVTTSGPCSLIYPVAAPDDADHCLCVSWLDEDGQTTIRRRLYGASEDIGTEDIAPIPADYMGEVLPATFYLEFWNVDGQQYINLPSNLTIYTSHTSQPSHSIDHSSASDATPSGTVALATAFPSTFPLTFNSTQTYP